METLTMQQAIEDIGAGEGTPRYRGADADIVGLFARDYWSFVAAFCSEVTSGHRRKPATIHCPTLPTPHSYLLSQVRPFLFPVQATH
jgi:hypothetical protein